MRHPETGVTQLDVTGQTLTKGQKAAEKMTKGPDSNHMTTLCHWDLFVGNFLQNIKETGLKSSLGLINTPTQKGEFIPQPCSGMNRTVQEIDSNRGYVPHPSLKPLHPMAYITQ